MPSDLTSALPPPGLPLQPAGEEAAGAAATGAGIGRIAHGTPAFWATSRAMFFGGFATFAMLYGLQPLMPMFSDEFALSPAAASGVVSAATGALALMLIPASLLADRIGRKPLMNAALFAAALLTFACGLSESFTQLLVLRVLLGVVLSGLPAVAMAYLAEEIDSHSLGRSMGLYIAGNGLGGLCGRLMVAALADWTSWRTAMFVLGAVGLLAALEFWRSLPVSRHFQPSRLSLAGFIAGARTHFGDAGMPWMFAIGFLMMGCFVSLYNYLGYRLAAPPFDLRPSLLGAVFSLYIVGMVGSTVVGRLADRFGRRHVLWIMICLMAAGLALTLASSLVVVMLGIATATFGFFGAHAVVSSWVGRRAQRARALASALYLFFFYMGSSVLGSGSGLMWEFGQWPAVAAFLGFVVAVSLAISLRLRWLTPLPVNAHRP
jgi:MFS transporter, YNFM family, putative membrane transport protein